MQAYCDGTYGCVAFSFAGRMNVAQPCSSSYGSTYAVRSRYSETLLRFHMLALARGGAQFILVIGTLPAAAAALQPSASP